MHATNNMFQKRLKFYTEEAQQNYALSTIVDRISGNETRYNAVVSMENYHQQFGVPKKITSDTTSNFCCGKPLSFEPTLSQMYCKSCGKTNNVNVITDVNQLYGIGLNTTTKYCYKTHSSKIISQLQGKERRHIPQFILDIVIQSHTSPAELLTVDSIRKSLSTSQNPKYIINGVKIKYILLQKQPPYLTRQEKKLIDFRLMLISQKVCPLRSIPYKFILQQLVSLVVAKSARKTEILGNFTSSANRTRITNKKLWDNLTQSLPILSSDPSPQSGNGVSASFAKQTSGRYRFP